MYFTLGAAPEAAWVSRDGTVSKLYWRPPATLPGGLYDFEISANRGGAVVRRTFRLELLARQVVASIDLDGGVEETLTVSDSGTPLDGLLVTVPPRSGRQVEVWALSGGLPSAPEGFEPFGVPFMVVGPTAPVQLRASPALLESVRGSMLDAPVAVTAHVPSADEAGGAHKVTVVGSTCPKGSGDVAVERADVLANYLEPKALAQLQRHKGQCYWMKQTPFELYYLDEQRLARTEVEARMSAVAAAAERARAGLAQPGCAPLEETVDTFVIPTSVSIAPPSGRQIMVNRSLTGSSLEAAVLHELSHTVHQRTVRWKNATTYDYDRTTDKAWSIEGLAVFNEDELSDTDNWRVFLSQTSWSLLNRETVSLGLRSNRIFHPHLQFAFFKALKARKAFTFCDYLAKRAVTNSAYSALDVMLGGADARRLEYAEFAATWLVPPLAAKGGRIDDDQLLPDALPDFASDSMIQKDALPSCACASGTTVKEVPLGSVAGGVGVKLSAKPGSDPCNYAITLVAPTRDATMLVFDSTGAELGAAKPNAVVTLPSGTMDTFVSVAIDQGREQDGLGNEAAVRLSIRGEPADCGPCCKVEGGRQFCTRPEVGPWKYRSPNGTRTIWCNPPYGDYLKIYDSEAEALSNIYAGHDCQCKSTPPGCTCEVTRGPPGAWQVGPGNYILGVEEGANRQLPLVRRDDCGRPTDPLFFDVGDWLARWRDVACPAGYTPTSQ